MTVQAFDPLSYENLGASITRAMDEQPVQSLVGMARFDGAGVYALYYTGGFAPYDKLAQQNRSHPGSWALYVGKAEAETRRKGDPNQTAVLDGPKLFHRIAHHRASIEKTGNLDPDDFQVRFLVLAPTWVPLAEQVGIRIHRPLWNVVVDGFGNHDPGSGRKEGTRSRWDTLHPGREWAAKLRPRLESETRINEDIVQHLDDPEQTLFEL
ncbi:Restriction endonuclease, type II, Eco29kI [Segniliparus rotundus DSM 44985]|uniref:Restriction endonuclease, type II, Eco29kI n=1 Tax=Segniliparus rotundus (strain ATCC BAA-972 / CDC 1076 / CIP 108378 / DSM 44985 / JCM 13578) TaxID=640132 RepID=D6Z789_SEGRD|nr:Eco29kI family restriction endonuclease [Segniliparus rotundus]ADG97819.1 Restriction endonuclease, type II, Eco29kI [Segniliparus rotundus DSM 44985]